MFLAELGCRTPHNEPGTLLAGLLAWPFTGRGLFSFCSDSARLVFYAWYMSPYSTVQGQYFVYWCCFYSPVVFNLRRLGARTFHSTLGEFSVTLVVPLGRHDAMRHRLLFSRRTLWLGSFHVCCYLAVPDSLQLHVNWSDYIASVHATSQCATCVLVLSQISWHSFTSLFVCLPWQTSTTLALTFVSDSRGHAVAVVREHAWLPLASRLIIKQCRSRSYLAIGTF